MQKALVLRFLLFILMPYGIAQDSFKLDRPRTKNFSKSIYHGDNQNWSIDQDKQGTLYFANSQGLLTFNRVNCNLYPLSKNTIARSAEVTATGKVFLGSYEEFGEFIKSALICNNICFNLRENFRKYLSNQ